MSGESETSAASATRTDDLMSIPSVEELRESLENLKWNIGESEEMSEEEKNDYADAIRRLEEAFNSKEEAKVLSAVSGDVSAWVDKYKHVRVRMNVESMVGFSFAGRTVATLLQNLCHMTVQNSKPLDEFKDLVSDVLTRIDGCKVLVKDAVKDGMEVLKTKVEDVHDRVSMCREEFEEVAKWIPPARQSIEESKEDISRVHKCLSGRVEELRDEVESNATTPSHEVESVEKEMKTRMDVFSRDLREVKEDVESIEKPYEEELQAKKDELKEIESKIKNEKEKWQFGECEAVRFEELTKTMVTVGERMEAIEQRLLKTEERGYVQLEGNIDDCSARYVEMQEGYRTILRYVRTLEDELTAAKKDWRKEKIVMQTYCDHAIEVGKNYRSEYRSEVSEKLTECNTDDEYGTFEDEIEKRATKYLSPSQQLERFALVKKKDKTATELLKEQDPEYMAFKKSCDFVNASVLTYIQDQKKQLMKDCGADENCGDDESTHTGEGEAGDTEDESEVDDDNWRQDIHAVGVELQGIKKYSHDLHSEVMAYKASLEEALKLPDRLKEFEERVSKFENTVSIDYAALHKSIAALHKKHEVDQLVAANAHAQETYTVRSIKNNVTKLSEIREDHEVVAEKVRQHERVLQDLVKVADRLKTVESVIDALNEEVVSEEVAVKEGDEGDKVAPVYDEGEDIQAISKRRMLRAKPYAALARRPKAPLKRTDSITRPLVREPIIVPDFQPVFMPAGKPHAILDEGGAKEKPCFVERNNGVRDDSEKVCQRAEPAEEAS
ncbi:myosin-3-like [Stylophora pistillata]|uniref:myosin-3-like n=1 Tax=Stylophora pistillata TaxID=50429 RepID=UPI000C057A50|nr:myosin-3-like [Stylophora pistillata]